MYPLDEECGVYVSRTLTILALTKGFLPSLRGLAPATVPLLGRSGVPAVSQFAGASLVPATHFESRLMCRLIYLLFYSYSVLLYTSALADVPNISSIATLATTHVSFSYATIIHNSR